MNLDEFYFFRIFEGVEKYFEKKWILRIFDSFLCVEYSTNLFFSKYFFRKKKRRIFDDWNIRRILSPFSAFRNRRIFDHFIVDYSIRRIFEGFKNIIFPFFVTKRWVIIGFVITYAWAAHAKLRNRLKQVKNRFAHHFETPYYNQNVWN